MNHTRKYGQDNHTHATSARVQVEIKATSSSSQVMDTTSGLDTTSGDIDTTSVTSQGIDAISSDASMTTTTGIPMSLLWVPYVTLTCVILVLMLVSFMHFHHRHGHKYRRRHKQLFGEISLPSFFRNFCHQTPVLPTQSHPPNGGISITMPPPVHPRPPAAPPPQHHRRPLTFLSNCNGSMVDVRCGNDASLLTFACCRTSSNSPTLWAARKLHGSAIRTGLFLTTGCHPSSSRDDQVQLLDQTRF